MDPPRPIPKSVKFEKKLLPPDHPLLGDKKTVIEYAINLGRQSKFIDQSLLSADRIKVIIQYLEEGDDETVSPTQDRDSKENKEPIPSGNGYGCKDGG